MAKDVFDEGGNINLSDAACVQLGKQVIKDANETEDRLDRLINNLPYKYRHYRKQLIELNSLKNKLFDESKKKHNQTCVYGCPDYDDICNKIYKEFAPIYEDFIRMSKDWSYHYDIEQMASIGAFLHISFGGWVDRYITEVKNKW